MTTASSNRRPARASLVVWVAMAVYILVLCAACHAKLNAYGYDDFDLAHHTQTLRNILHGSLECSVLGIPFLGNHMVLILYLIAPLYVLLPSPLLLLYLQSALLGAGAWGVYLLARRGVPGVWAAALALLYLVYPPLLYMNLFEFHPVALSACFLIYTLHFYVRQRVGPFLLMLMLATSCQENIGLIAAAFGICALLSRRSARWVLVPMVSGTVFFVLSVGIVMPELNQDTIQFRRLYGHIGDSLPEVFVNLLRHPIASLRASWHPSKLVFVNLLLAPVGYLSLLSPATFVPLLPVLAQRLLSTRTSEASILYHYQAEFIPFIFAAAAVGMQRILNWRSRIAKPLLTSIMVLFPVIALLTTGVLPALRDAFRGQPKDFPGHVADRALAGIPDEAPVAATFGFLPKLSGRKELHSLSHIYYGHYTLSDKAFPVPQEVDFMVMNTMDRITFEGWPFYGPTHHTNLQAFLGDDPWQVMVNAEGLLVLADHRGDTDTVGSLIHVMDKMPSGTNVNRNVHQDRDADIRLVGFTVGNAPADGVIPLTLIWEKARDTGGDYDALLSLTHAGKVFYHHEFAPGSRIFPPQSWPAGKFIADRHGIPAATRGISAAGVHAHVDLIRLNR